MTLAKYAAALVLLAAAGLVPVKAEEAITGRWSVSPGACALFGNAETAPLIVTDSAVRWHDDACRIGRVYKTGDTIHIQALCWGLSGERSIPISLRPHGGLLAVTWDRRGRGDLRRCQ